MWPQTPSPSNSAKWSHHITSLGTALAALCFLVFCWIRFRRGTDTEVRCYNPFDMRKYFPCTLLSPFSACFLLILHKQPSGAVWEIESHRKRCKYFAYKIKYTTRWPPTNLFVFELGNYTGTSLHSPDR